MNLDRREFLKKIGTGMAAGVVVGAVGSESAHLSETARLQQQIAELQQKLDAANAQITNLASSVTALGEQNAELIHNGYKGVDNDGYMGNITRDTRNFKDALKTSERQTVPPCTFAEVQEVLAQNGFGCEALSDERDEIRPKIILCHTYTGEEVDSPNGPKSASTLTSGWNDKYGPQPIFHKIMAWREGDLDNKKMVGVRMTILPDLLKEQGGVNIVHVVQHAHVLTHENNVFTAEQVFALGNKPVEYFFFTRDPREKIGFDVAYILNHADISDFTTIHKEVERPYGECFDSHRNVVVPCVAGPAKVIDICIGTTKFDPSSTCKKIEENPQFDVKSIIKPGDVEIQLGVVPDYAYETLSAEDAWGATQ